MTPAEARAAYVAAYRAFLAEHDAYQALYDRYARTDEWRDAVARAEADKIKAGFDAEAARDAYLAALRRDAGAEKKESEG